MESSSREVMQFFIEALLQIEERRERHLLQIGERLENLLTQLFTPLATQKRIEPPPFDRDGDSHVPPEKRSQWPAEIPSQAENDILSTLCPQPAVVAHHQDEPSIDSNFPLECDGEGLQEESLGIEEDTLQSHSGQSLPDRGWFIYPNGNATYRVPLALFSEVESTGYAYLHLWQKGSKKSGTFIFKRQCAGALVCAQQCGYVQRPFVNKKQSSSDGGKYQEKDYRKFCHGSCLEAGKQDVPLLHVTCDCLLYYRGWAHKKILEIEHQGLHDHPKPPLARATGAELEVYKKEAGLRIPPKKKLLPQKTYPMRI